MLAQVRMYTINKGKMDVFLKQFEEVVIPMHARINLPIAGTWVNRPQNEFIWVRSFTDEADREAKLKAFQDLRDSEGIVLGTEVTKMEIREVESLFVPSTSAV